MPASRRFGHPFDVHSADGSNNAYYQNLVGQRTLLHSDQELFNGNAQDMLARQYINTPRKISTNFVSAM
jgi:peroxidase